MTKRDLDKLLEINRRNVAQAIESFHESNEKARQKINKVLSYL